MQVIGTESLSLFILQTMLIVERLDLLLEHKHSIEIVVSPVG